MNRDFCLATVLAFLVASFVIGCTSDAPSAKDPPPPHRVLLIGNADLADHGGLANALTRLSHGMLNCAESSAQETLAWHWTHGRADRIIRSERWDDVVLQDDAEEILRRPEIFSLFVRRFSRQIGASGARTIVMTSWPRRDRAGEGPEISDTCQNAAAESDATIAPVAAAWRHSLRKRPDLALYGESGASQAGTYLAACVLYKTLLNRTPVGLESFVVDAEGKPLITLAPADASFLQHIADQAVETEQSPTDPDLKGLLAQ